MLFWAGFVIVIGFGIVCLVLGYRAPAEKAEEAATLIRGGWRIVGGGVLLLVIRRLFTGFSE